MHVNITSCRLTIEVHVHIQLNAFWISHNYQISCTYLSNTDLGAYIGPTHLMLSYHTVCLQGTVQMDVYSLFSVAVSSVSDFSRTSFEKMGSAADKYCV